MKGITLEEDGVVMFSDAPTERGVKHLNELVQGARTNIPEINIIQDASPKAVLS